MRITEHERLTIISAITTHDANAVIYLFGSRIDDQARGGDIDLLVLSSNIDLMQQLNILGELHQCLGDRKIDILVESDLNRPFTSIAVSEGIRL